MLIGAPRNCWHDSRNAQLCAFLNRPFHAVKLENGKKKCDVGVRHTDNFLAQFELNAIGRDAGNPPSTDRRTHGNVELLAHARAQNANQVVGVVASQGSPTAGNFIGDPSSASHLWRLILGGATLQRCDSGRVLHAGFSR